MSLPKLFEKAAFVLNRDFTIDMEINDISKDAKLGKNEFNGSLVYIEAVPTVSNGMCYILTFEKVSPTQKLWIGIVPNENLLNDTKNSPKGVITYITTKNTRFNVIDESLIVIFIIYQSFINSPGRSGCFN